MPSFKTSFLFSLAASQVSRLPGADFGEEYAKPKTCFCSTRPAGPVDGTAARGGRAEKAVLDKNVPSFKTSSFFSRSASQVSRLAVLGAGFGEEYAQL